MWKAKQSVVQAKEKKNKTTVRVKKKKKNQKQRTSVIYELKEVHYSQEEAQTKTQTE